MFVVETAVEVQIVEVFHITCALRLRYAPLCADSYANNAFFLNAPYR